MRETVHQQAVMHACVTQGLRALKHVVLGLHLLVSPSQCAEPPEVREGAELDNLEKHSDRILASVVGDEAAGVLVAGAARTAPGIQARFNRLLRFLVYPDARIFRTNTLRRSQERTGGQPCVSIQMRGSTLFHCTALKIFGIFCIAAGVYVLTDTYIYWSNARISAYAAIGRRLK